MTIERLEDVLGGWVNGPTDDSVNTVPSVIEALRRLDPGEGDLLEVGLRRGGTALLRALAAQRRELVTVDPYGGLPYLTDQGDGSTLSIYGDPDELAARRLLAGVPRWQHWRLTSEQFFQHVTPLGYWRGGRRHPYRFGSVFLDGSHAARDVELDLVSLAQGLLLPVGTVAVDNTDYPQPGGVTLRAHVERQCSDLELTCWPLLAGERNEVCVVSRLSLDELRRLLSTK